MSPSTKKGKENHKKLSKPAAKSWWKLEASDRTEHNQFMRIQLLSPFLYGKLYQDEIWVEWAKSAQLLAEGRTSEMDELSDEELKNTDLMELAIIKLQDKINNDHKISPQCGVLEGILECIDDCQKIEALEAALNFISDKDWFCSVKLQLLNLVTYTISGKCGAAILLVAWQISFYVKSVHRGEKILEIFNTGSSLDTESDASKEKGNEYFKSSEYSKAIATYTTILYAKPYLHIVYGNRAICYIRKHQYRAALADGRRCTTLNPKWFKGQKRFGEALFELGYNDAAVKVLTNAIDICESNAMLVDYLQEIKIKINNDNKMNNFTARLTEGFKNGMKTQSKNNVDNDEEVESEGEDSEGIPDLVTDSDDDDENPVAPFKNKKSKTKAKENDETIPNNMPSYFVGSLLDNKDDSDKLAKRRHDERVKKEADDEKSRIEVKRNQVLTMIKRASISILEDEEDKTYSPMNDYKKSIDIVNLQPNILSRKEIVILHYAHAVSYLNSGKNALIETSIEMFKEIIMKYKDIVTPLPFLGIGKAYHKLNNFQKMNKPLRRALKLDGQPGCLTNCCWPGVGTVIEETLPGRLKEVVDKMMDNPPKPDGTCRYEYCSFGQAFIYFGDLEFAGFIRVICTKNCFVEYHSTCWLKVRPSYMKNELLLQRKCITVECGGSVKTIQVYTTPDKKLTNEYTDMCTPVDLKMPSSKSPKVKKKDKKNKSNDDEEENKENSRPVKGKSKKKKGTKVDNESWLLGLYEKSTKFDFGKFSELIDNPKYKAFEIFNYVEKLLKDHAEPYIDLSNNKDIQCYLSSMAVGVRQFLEEGIGGLRVLLSKCDLFSFDEKELNILFLTSQRPLYEKYKRIRKHHLATSPPECEEPLFNSPKLLKTKTKTATDSTKKEKGNFVRALEGLNDNNFETSNFSIEEVDPHSKTVSKVHVITIEGKKNKHSEQENASAKVLQSCIEEYGRDSFDIKKKCSECGCTVIEDYLCRCIDAKKYDELYVKPEDHALGVYTTSKPPHNKQIKTDPVSKWFEKTLNEDRKPKIEEINDGDKQSDDDNDDNDKSPGCVVNVGIQADLTMPERKKNNTLMDINKELISKAKVLQSKNDKIMEDMKKQKIKYGMSDDRLRNENLEQKKLIDKMKKEMSKSRHLNETEMKRLRNDKKEAVALVTSLEERIEQMSIDHEKKLDSLLMQKAKEIDQIKRELLEISRHKDQENEDHEEIVNDLTQNVVNQSRRAEKVEVALLESKKETVVMKYQQQAHVIQNTINQMQYLAHLPEMHQIRKIWEDYKIEYQASYERMQEEFANLIQTVKDGHPLESLRPAKYAIPPEYPHCPMPVGKPQVMMNQPRPQGPSHPMMPHIVRPINMPPPSLPQTVASHTQQIPQHHSNIHRNAQPTYQPPNSVANNNNNKGVIGHRSSEEQVSTPATPGSNTKAPVKVNSTPETTQGVSGPSSNTQINSKQINTPPLSRVPYQYNYSDSDEEADALSKSSDGLKYGKMDEKVLIRLGSIFPTAPREELASHFNDYRKQGPLSGQRIEDIVTNVERMIQRSKQIRSEANKQENKQNESKARKVPRVQGSEGSGVLENGANKRTRANQVATKNGFATGYTTSLLDDTKSSTTTKHNIFGQEEPCVICYEDMSPNTALLLHCGHTFHKNCISCWLKEQRTCPVCRVLALLPEEYPALSTKSK